MLSVIIPSYKGATILKRNVPILINYLNTKNILHEIIIVDDGTSDVGETEKTALELGCSFMANEKNSGKGASVRRGMLAAKGDYRIFTDVDIPFEPEAFERFLHYLEFKEFDLVVGDRTLADSSYFSEISSSRKFGSNLFSFIVGRFITSGFFDTQCGMKGFSAKVANDIFSKSRINRFAFDAELIYIALKRNYDIKRLPVKLRNNNETSTVNLLNDALPMLIDLLKIKVNHLRKRYEK
jgi:dolichyl-phosphate beta-glucosyltransferase